MFSSSRKLLTAIRVLLPVAIICCAVIIGKAHAGASGTALTLTLSSSSVKGGTQVTGLVQSIFSGVTVHLKSSDTAAATVPASVFIPGSKAGGGGRATFTITTYKVAANKSVVITATEGGSTARATLTVTP